MQVILVQAFASFCILSAMASTTFSPLTDKNVDKYALPLREDDDYLEPLLDAATMRQHYDGLFQKYTTNLNGILDEWRLEKPNDVLSKDSVVNMLKKLNTVPEKYRMRVRKFAGGFVNHLMYFKKMSPNKDGAPRIPQGELLEEINKKFGSFERFKEEFTKSAMAVFGSGYTFLARDNGVLKIINHSNQDSVLSDGQLPIVVLDLWEHAYYGKHEIRRAAYIEDWWKLIDFGLVADMAKHFKSTGHDEL